MFNSAVCQTKRQKKRRITILRYCEKTKLREHEKRNLRI